MVAGYGKTVERNKSRDQKWREHDCWYQGWHDFLNGSPISPPPDYNPEDCGQYFAGAERARMRNQQAIDAGEQLRAWLDKGLS
jgi:hypothetical protein